jgi:hypothetical protein
MALEIKDTASIATKWSQRAGAAGSEFAAGAAGKGAKCAQASIAAADSYKAAVTAAAGAGRYERGVSRSTAAKFDQKIAAVGASRYPQGVAAGQNAYQTGFEPYAGTIKGLSLSPRAPKGSPQNIERVRQVADALHAKKISG